MKIFTNKKFVVAFSVLLTILLLLIASALYVYNFTVAVASDGYMYVVKNCKIYSLYVLSGYNVPLNADDCKNIIQKRTLYSSTVNLPIKDVLEIIKLSNSLPNFVEYDEPMGACFGMYSNTNYFQVYKSGDVFSCPTGVGEALKSNIDYYYLTAKIFSYVDNPDPCVMLANLTDTERDDIFKQIRGYQTEGSSMS